MGTRGHIHIVDGETPLISLYKHFDTYPIGLGAELKARYGELWVVNGYAMNQPREVVNGIEELALRVICDFKMPDGHFEAGGFYLAPTMKDIRTELAEGWPFIEFHYVLSASPERDAKLDLVLYSMYGLELYRGPLAEFDPERAQNDFHSYYRRLGFEELELRRQELRTLEQALQEEA